MPKLTKTRQAKVLRDLLLVARSTDLPEAWTLLCIGAVTALGDSCPPHWHINVLCGRADRLREEAEAETLGK